jgi:uncharacterized protein YprB with RNaseH-like and TPR domain
MLHKIPLHNILFFDIETAAEQANFFDLSDEKQHLFDLKTAYQRKEEYTPEEFYDRAGIWAEFGKIICISVGYFVLKNDSRNFRVTSLFGEEKKILQDFTDLINQHFSQASQLLCGHNAKEFDIPYIARRMLIHGMSLPEKLNLFGKKPWEVPHLDTMELWRFGDYKHFTSLRLLTNVLNIPSPKDDIDGSEVNYVYWVENDIDRIVTYCEKDVIAVAQILLRLRGEDLLVPEEIKHV